MVMYVFSVGVIGVLLGFSLKEKNKFLVFMYVAMFILNMFGAKFLSDVAIENMVSIIQQVPEHTIMLPSGIYNQVKDYCFNIEEVQ